MGFLWCFKTHEASPFDCAVCADTDRDARNCFNRRRLDEDARAVARYTDEIKFDIRKKGAKRVVSIGAIRLYECPLSYITAETREMMNLVFLVDDTGHLLHQGGWAEQPAWLVEAYQIYRVENAKRLKDIGDAK